VTLAAERVCARLTKNMPSALLAVRRRARARRHRSNAAVRGVRSRRECLPPLLEETLPFSSSTIFIVPPAFAAPICFLSSSQNIATRSCLSERYIDVRYFRVFVISFFSFSFVRRAALPPLSHSRAGIRQATQPSSCHSHATCYAFTQTYAVILAQAFATRKQKLCARARRREHTREALGRR